MRKFVFLAVATAVVTAGAASAQGGHGAKIDTNGDGQVSLAEMNAKAATRFAKLDGDRDGFVTSAEMTAHREAMKAKHSERAEKRGGRGHGDHLARLDSNNDGRLSLAEFQARNAKRLERLDTDKNGSISREEFSAAREAWKGKRKG